MQCIVVCRSYQRICFFIDTMEHLLVFPSSAISRETDSLPMANTGCLTAFPSVRPQCTIEKCADTCQGVPLCAEKGKIKKKLFFLNYP